MIRSLRILMRWFPERRFVFAGDGGFGTHEFARFAHQTQGRLTLVSRFYADANLYQTPPTTKGRGRPRVKGAKQPSPAQVVSRRRKRRRLKVGWYGGGQRRVETVTETGQWYKAGEGLVPVRWIYVHDCSGTHRDEYFFTTDLQQSVKDVIETFTGRWNIETTFQEMRAYLGLETTRGWTRKTVLRAAPCLFGLYSVVALLYDLLPKKHKAKSPIAWEGKSETTFSDAITAVRRWLWTDWIFATAGHDQAFSKLPPLLRRTLLYGLAGAA
jgi:hypothetical protein